MQSVLLAAGNKEKGWKLVFRLIVRSSKSLKRIQK